MSGEVDWVIELNLSERHHRLAVGVWKRLPEHDQAVLRSQLLSFTSQESTKAGEMGRAELNDDQFVLRFVCDDVKERVAVITLATNHGLSDEAQMAVIAHEFAHVVLRHPHEKIILNMAVERGEYKPCEREAIRRAHEDAADFLACMWGFGNELLQFYEEQPKPKPPLWLRECCL